MPIQNTPRLDSLTGLRWWAAFGVFLYHLAPSGAVGIHSRFFFLAGHTGVAFFFILSGFVLTWSSRPEVTPKQFWWRRFARIWPAHAVALILAIPVFYSFTGPSPHFWIKPADFTIFALCLFLLQGFFLDAKILFGGNPAAWTLSCEALFYAIFPGLIPVVKRSGRLILIAATIVVIGYGMALTYFPAMNAALPAVLTRIWQFLIGVLVATAVKRGLYINIGPRYVVAILLVCFAAAGPLAAGLLGPRMAHLSVRATSVGFALLYALAIWALASTELAGARSFLSSRLMVKAGEWSYAFYLVHATVLYGYRTLLGHRAPGGWFGIGSFILMFGMSLLLAYLLHTFVERPCEKRIRAWADKRYERPRKANQV